MAKVLFVCFGNVGRSQMAEAFYNFYTRSKDGYSAGVNPETPIKYSKLPDEICQIMLEEDIDIRHQAVKTIDKKFVADATKIFIMCKREQCPDFLVNSGKAEYWEIENSHYLDIENMRRIRNQIKARVLSIVPNNK